MNTNSAHTIEVWERIENEKIDNQMTAQLFKEKVFSARIKVSNGWIYRTVVVPGSGGGASVAQTFIPDM